MLDTDRNVPEELKTLQFQQKQLIDGKRSVQMFPNGTEELECPKFYKRYKTSRGVFHYDPRKITAYQIHQLSSEGRENEFLNLGPYNKTDIFARMGRGEKLVFITELTKDGIEIRSAAGTTETINDQQKYFHATMEPNSVIIIGMPPQRVLKRFARDQNDALRHQPIR